MSQDVGTVSVPRPAQEPRQPRRPSHPLIGYLFLLLIAVYAAPLVTTIAMGAKSYERIARNDPGLATGIVTTLARVTADLSALATVGALVSMLFLGRGSWTRIPGRRRLEPSEWFESVLIPRAAAMWLLSSLGLVIFEAADSNGLPVAKMTDLSALKFGLFSGDYPRAWMVSAVAAAICLGIGLMARSWGTYFFALWAATLGTLAPVVVGQVLVGPDHDFASDAAIFQTIGLFGAVGVVLIATLRLASGRPLTASGRSRWFGVAAVGLAITVAAEVLIVWFKLAGTSIWESATGQWSLVRFLGFALIGIGMVGARKPIAARALGRARGWLALSTAGIAVVFAAGVANTRIPPPQYFVDTSISQIFLGFSLPDAPSFAVLVTHWRPNLLFGLLALIAVTAYLTAVIRLRRRAVKWPVLRTIAWVFGWLIVIVATSSGFGKYSGANFAVHMGVHMTLNMAAPIFLVLGGPFTLALRCFPAAKDDKRPGPREWITAVLSSRGLHFLHHPLLVFVLYIGSYYGLYFTGAFGTLMRFHWAHQAMNLHFLIVGFLYFGLVVGVDATPRKLPHIGKLGYIMAAMPFHAFFGVILMSASVIVGENFYKQLDQPWATNLADTQQIAGGVAWAGGEIPLLIVVMVLAIQWAIQDNRDAKRIDRRMDERTDGGHEAYNQMLQRLQEHDTRSRPGSPKDSR